MPKARLKYFFAWPTYLELDGDFKRQGELNDIAKIVKVPIPKPLATRFGYDPKHPIPADSADAPFVVARCVTEMRRNMNEILDARVVLGGRVSGFSGKYPGILEEVHLSLTQGTRPKPVYLLGAFGGCADLVGRAVRGEPVEEFSLDYQLEHSKPVGNQAAYGKLVDLYDRYKNEPGLSDGPVDYNQILADLKMAGVDGLNNGLSAEENDELFRSDNLDRVMFLLVKGLTTALGSM